MRAQAQNKLPPKRPALSLLDTDDTDDKNQKPAPKRPVKRARKTQLPPRQEYDEEADGDDDDNWDVPVSQVQVANINRYVQRRRNTTEWLPRVGSAHHG